MNRPVLALTQGDPTGIGPEILLKILSDEGVGCSWRPLLIAERAALEGLRAVVPEARWERLRYYPGVPARGELAALAADAVAVVDPVGRPRTVTPGQPTAADAAGTLAALDAGIDAARSAVADALVTAPLNKAVVARHGHPDFRGHTDYLAGACGLRRYGRDYLMAFLAPQLRVALLTTHLALAEAVAAVRRERIVEALACLHRHVSGRIAVAGLNPHAGEEGLVGSEEIREIRPAIEQARRAGIDAVGPESPDSLFARARRGEFAWVLALYHDQGLIAVKTAAFGAATNWTVGLPFLRTSVDHGTAYEIAGRGVADDGSLRAVVATTLGLLAERHKTETTAPADDGRC
ncbi:MAG: 4-hydroxythreonine-4-phosphate dehydrogenase PdxA [bacterium]|nr:4-hydroxythreonine-4-phosphate dehydrogenase PdxA [bacterium]